MKALKLIGITLLVVGIGMLAGGIFFYIHTSQWIQNSVKTMGMVVDFERSLSNNRSFGIRWSYRPLVQFHTATGEQIRFTSNLGSNQPPYQTGQNVRVIYDAGNPGRAEIDSFFAVWMGVIVLTGLGMVFTAVSLGILGFRQYFQQKRDWLTTNGLRLETVFKETVLDAGITKDGRHPYRIFTEWTNPQTGQTYGFRSKSIWFDPSSYFTGQPVIVYADPRNLRKHLMDISFLPEKGQ
jgi:hypothetical protein